VNKYFSLVIWALALTSKTLDAQSVTFKSSPINGWSSQQFICVDADCQSAGISPSNEPLAGMYFVAKTYVAMEQQNALVAQQIDLLKTLVQKSTDTHKLIAQQINSFNQDLRSSINARFDALPPELANSEAMRKALENLKQEIVKIVDDKLKTLPQTNAVQKH
jgi:hypothetical protein